MKSKSLIVHIGLPKTGTTSLQKNLFPLLCIENNILYNPPEYSKIKDKDSLFYIDDKKKFEKVLQENDVLISEEGLVGWNPRNWQSASERVLDLFGRRAKIVITIRDPIDYLTSVWIQQIQEGRIIEPSNFFLNRIDYDKKNPLMKNNSLDYFDFDSLDYEFLYKLYSERFDEVYILPLSQISSIYPFKSLYRLSDESIASYRKNFLNSKKQNISFSRVAIKLSLIKEKALKTTFNRFPLLGNFTSRLLSLFFRTRIFSWRWWMHNVVNKLFPYEKPYLPKEITSKFDQNLFQANTNFVKTHARLIKKSVNTRDNKNF